MSIGRTGAGTGSLAAADCASSASDSSSLTSRISSDIRTSNASQIAESSSEDASFCPPLHLGEIAERNSGGRGDFAQSTALALALPTQHVTQQATEQNHRWLPPLTV
ncbi:hypothetical protein GCM10020254_26160 [Streptomyces goshikiensis]